MKNRFNIFLKIIILTLLIFIPLKVFSQYYGIATNLYYDTNKSCDDTRFYIFKKGLDSPLSYDDKINFITPITAGHFKSDDHFVKRIVGLPGDEITAKGDDLFINNIFIKKRPLLKNIRQSKNQELHVFANDFKITLKDDEYFVLGKIDAYSFDSRYWGPIPYKNILGLVVY